MVATFEQLRTKNLKTFDELRKKPEPPDYGRVALPKERLPGVWDYDKQLDQLLGDPEIDIEKMMPLDVRYDFGRIVGMTEKPDETKDRMKSSLYYSIIFGKPPEITFNVLDKLNEIATGVKVPAATAWGRIKDRYRGGKKQVQAMDFGFDLLKRTWHDWEAYEKSVETIEKLQSGVKDDVRRDFRGFFEKTFGAAAEQLPILWETVKESPVGALAGGFIGAAMAIMGGLTVPAPEEIITIPAATIKGAAVGAGVRGAIRIGQLEAGGMFLEIAQMEDSIGNKIDPKIAAVACYSVGTINGAIEMAEWAILLSTFGIGTKLFEKSAAKVTSKMFAEGTLKNIVAKNVLKYGAALGAETLQEIEQETSNVVFGELAKELNNARKGTDFKPISAEDLKRRYREVTVESLRAFGVILAPGISVSTAIDIATRKPEVIKPAVGVKEVKAEIPPTEAIPAPEKPVEPITKPEAVEVAPPKIAGKELKKSYERVIKQIPPEIAKGIDVKTITSGTFTEMGAEDRGGRVHITGGPFEKTPTAYHVQIDTNEVGNDDTLLHELLHAYVLNHPELVGEGYFAHEDATDKLFKQIKQAQPVAKAEPAKEPWKVIIKSQIKGRPKVIEFPDGTRGGVYDRGVLGIKRPTENIARQIGKTELTAASWDKRGLQPKDLKQFRDWWAQEALKEAEPAKPKTIEGMSDSQLLEIRREILSIENIKRKPQEIKELQLVEDELVSRHQEEYPETDISQKTRNKEIKETAESIRNEDLYRDAEQALGERYQALPLKRYSIARNKADIPGEVKDYIGKPGEKGYKGYLWKYLTTIEESPSAMGYDEALEAIGGRPGDIGEFIRLLDEIVQQQKGVKGIVNQVALDEAIATGEPYIELLAMKYEMLKTGFNAQEINDTIKKWAQDNDVDVGLVEKDYVPVEGKQDVKTKQQILRELEKASKKVARKKIATPEEIAIGKAQQLAYKTKETHYVSEKTGKDVGLYKVSVHPPTEGRYQKITPPEKGKLVSDITEEYVGLKPEEAERIKKEIAKELPEKEITDRDIIRRIVEEKEKILKRLRQKIHAVAIKKGLTKKALSELKLKHTGYRHLIGKIAEKKITTEQLNKLLKAVQKARPKQVGYKKVITKKTEKKIQSLKENLVRKTQMTERHYDQILEIEVRGKEPKYTDARNFITETQGKDILRRMLDTAEIVRLTESFEQAIAKSPEITDRVKLLDSRIAKAPKRDPYSLESMRYYNQQAEVKTGAPIFTSYMDLLDTHLDIIKTRTATWKRLEKTTAKFKEIAKDEDALRRVGDYIASQSTLKEKPAMPTDITADEIKLAKEIQKILEEYRIKVRVSKFYNWYYYNQPIPDHDRYTREITKAVDIYESKGKEELIEYLETQEWGVIKSGYEPLEILFHKIRPYTTGPTAVGKGHVKIRTDIEYHKQERNILQRLSAYMRQIDTLYNLSPKINAYVRLYDDNASKFSDWGKVKNDVEIFLQNLKRYNIEGGFFQRTISRAYSQAMRVIIMPSPILSFRNLFQNAAFEHDKSILIDPRNTELTNKDIEYLETYVLQTRAMVEEYFMVGEKPLPGLRMLTKLIDKLKLYPYSDIANRHWSFWAKTNQVKRALKAETTKQMMTDARFEDMKELEQRRALAILARDGKKAMTQYIGRVHVDDIHFLYERAQRSPAEMTSLGKIVGNLMLFPRAYGEKLAHTTNKMLKGKTYQEQWRGLKTIFAVVGGGMIVGSIYTMITGRKRNPYNPLEILAFRPGGLAWGSIEAATEIYANILSATKGDSRALAALTVAIPRAADMFIPFYDYTLRAIEAATDQKNIDRKALRKMRMMIDKEYKIRGGAYKVKRNALEKWQYFISGPSAEKEEEKKAKPKKITR